MKAGRCFSGLSFGNSTQMLPLFRHYVAEPPTRTPRLVRHFARRSSIRLARRSHRARSSRIDAMRPSTSIVARRGGHGRSLGLRHAPPRRGEQDNSVALRYTNHRGTPLYRVSQSCCKTFAYLRFRPSCDFAVTTPSGNVSEDQAAWQTSVRILGALGAKRRGEAVHLAEKRGGFRRAWRLLSRILE